jgi:LmbE family N-acetylglucosaminyl deacetylase
MKVLVISPHPDDEVLGVGGTIVRLANEGNDVTVVIVTKGWSPLFAVSQVRQVRAEARRANKILGVKSLKFMNLPVTKLNAIPKHQLNGKFERLMDKEKPQLVFLPFCGDLQEDHRQVFDACMVALRPALSAGYLRQILCYEAVSETHLSAARIGPCFEPQLWVDISDYLPVKLDAMRSYKSQLRQEPDARSLVSISSLARWRGNMVGMSAAECFIVVRQFWATP